MVGDIFIDVLHFFVPKFTWCFKVEYIFLQANGPLLIIADEEEVRVTNEKQLEMNMDMMCG